MPIFEFVCHACGKEFELLLMGSDKPKCPHCDSEELSKLMSAFALRSKDGAGNVTSSGGGSQCGGCAGGSCSTC